AWRPRTGGRVGAGAPVHRGAVAADLRGHLGDPAQHHRPGAVPGSDLGEPASDRAPSPATPVLPHSLTLRGGEDHDRIAPPPRLRRDSPTPLTAPWGRRS